MFGGGGRPQLGKYGVFSMYRSMALAPKAEVLAGVKTFPKTAHDAQGGRWGRPVPAGTALVLGQRAPIPV